MSSLTITGFSAWAGAAPPNAADEANTTTRARRLPRFVRWLLGVDRAHIAGAPAVRVIPSRLTGGRSRGRPRIAVAATACLFGCSIAAPQYTLAKGQRGAPNTTRFAVLPTNALVPASPELSGAATRVLGHITHYLSAQGRKRSVIDPLRTQRLWLASIALANESDVVSHDFHGAIEIFARKLGGPTAFDALVVSSLVYRKARLHNRRIKWDGAVRSIRDGKDETAPIPESFEASVPAVSLHVMVFGASGDLIFENYGGVDLAHSLTMEPGDEGGLHAELLDPALSEHRFLREGVVLAFDPYLPRERAVGW
jgi:predicted nucleic acid-binding protein